MSQNCVAESLTHKDHEEKAATVQTLQEKLSFCVYWPLRVRSSA